MHGSWISLCSLSSDIKSHFVSAEEKACRNYASGRNGGWQKMKGFLCYCSRLPAPSNLFIKEVKYVPTAHHRNDRSGASPGYPFNTYPRPKSGSVTEFECMRPWCSRDGIMGNIGPRCDSHTDSHCYLCLCAERKLTSKQEVAAKTSAGTCLSPERKSSAH